MSIGATAWTASEAGDPIIAEYDADSAPAEQLFLVVSGGAIFNVEGETLTARPGTLVFTAPGVNRTGGPQNPARPSSPSMVRHTAYDATGWELWAPLVPLNESGQHTELASRMVEVIATNPQYPMLGYNLACCESLSGRTDEAIEHLRQAVQAAEKFRADARDDADFDPVRNEPAFRR